MADVVIVANQTMMCTLCEWLLSSYCFNSLIYSQRVQSNTYKGGHEFGRKLRRANHTGQEKK